MRVTKRVEFDAAHRLMDHQGLCRNLHGHRWVAEVTVDGPMGGGMVLDFAVLKDALNSLIKDHWDHALLLDWRDGILLKLASEEHWRHVAFVDPPTSETLAQVLLEHLVTTLPDFVKVCSVRVWETPSAYAELVKGDSHVG